MSRKIGIYIHVPFCESKCPYCDFFSVPCDEETMDKFVAKVCEDVRKWSRINRKADTLYFGGGTPSLLGTKRIEKIINSVSESFAVFDDKYAEVTLEVNPTSLEKLDFKNLLRCGVNRLSIGLQSSNEQELFLLGRNHSPDDAKKVVYTAQTTGFENISLDLMVAIPAQTSKSLTESINFCKRLQVQHVSMYMLKIEPGTQYYLEKSKLMLPDEEKESDLYLLACEHLEKSGFMQYEISNFSLKGYEGRHNLKYWNAEEYLGIGPSAHSFIAGKRFYFCRSLKKFLKGANFIEDGLGGNEEEYVLLRMRLKEGLENEKFKKRFGYDIPQKYFQNAYKYKNLGLIDMSDNFIRLTRKGFLLSNQVILGLLN